MANLVRARSWGDVKPPLGATIDWGHPLAQGLASCFLFNDNPARALDLCQENAVTNGTTAPTVSPLGASFAGTGSQQIRATVRRANSFTGMTIDCVTRIAAANKGGFVFFGGNDANGVGVGVGSTTYDGVGTNFIAIDAGHAWEATTVSIPLGSLVHSAVTNPPGNGSTVRAYMNGVLRKTWSSLLSAGGNTFYVGAQNNTARTFTGDVVTARCWGRPLTASEVAWLAAEPYAFIAPPGPKTLYVFLSPPPVTGTSAQTLDAFTSSASGGVGASGTSTQTLAAFTSTASGGVGPSGTSGQTLADFTPSATGGTGPSGTSAQTLAAFTSSVSGGTGPSGTSAQTLSAFTSTTSGGAGPAGTLAVTLGAFTLDASGTAGSGITYSTTCALLTEDGKVLLTEDGQRIILEECIQPTPAHGGHRVANPRALATAAAWREHLIDEDDEILVLI